MPATSRRPSLQSAARNLARLAMELRSSLREEGGKCQEQARQSLESALGREVPPDEWTDIAAQGIACGRAIAECYPQESAAASQWLLAQCEPWERWILERVLGLRDDGAKWSARSASGRSSDRVGFRCNGNQPENGSSVASARGASGPHSFADPTHLYEHFLQHHARQTRRRSGVFFTPRPIADYILDQVEQLVTQSGLPRSRLRLVDPAAGTGVFLLAAIERASRSRRPDGTFVAADGAWSEQVSELLARMTGIEILPAAAVLAKLNIAVRLAQTGFRFDRPVRINVLVGDALQPTTLQKLDWPADAVPVVVGNPPFSALTGATNPWMARLLRGDDEVRGYTRAGELRLGERKTWLHDDYVKFLRLAQWLVERAGCGIVAYVTNHGYLDNATFHLLRHELLRVFPRIRLVDLHGSRKKGEVGPAGDDENVFGLDQGVAIGVLCRAPGVCEESSRRGAQDDIEYAELWGPAATKLSRLEQAGREPLPFASLDPQPPHWRLVPSRQMSCSIYDASWSLTDAMPVSTSAPVTARDHFVVAVAKVDLEQRIAEFRELSIPDDTIRKRYFHRTRSRRYEPGDTRGWKLSAARQIVAADKHWADHIQRCLYRAFDWRYVFWHPAMIDWPRTKITRHLLPILNPQSAFRNLALLTRRQQLPTQPCNFFWIADGLALDGVIRSDNRGSESLFPLYLQEEAGNGFTWRANFAPQFVADMAGAARLTSIASGKGDLLATLGPEDVLAYIYALFHTPAYRQRYAPQLASDFPRVLLPQSPEGFQGLCRVGHELVDLHLLHNVMPAAYLEELPEAVREFRVGSYEVLSKWLKGPGRSAGDRHHLQMAAAIERTLALLA